MEKQATTSTSARNSTTAALSIQPDSEPAAEVAIARPHAYSLSTPIYAACTGKVQDLTDDLLALVFSFLDVRTRCGSVGRVSKSWILSLKSSRVWFDSTFDAKSTKDGAIRALVRFCRDGNCCPERLTLPLARVSGLHHPFVRSCCVSSLLCFISGAFSA